MYVSFVCIYIYILDGTYVISIKRYNGYNRYDKHDRCRRYYRYDRNDRYGKCNTIDIYSFRLVSYCKLARSFHTCCSMRDVVNLWTPPY